MKYARKISTHNFQRFQDYTYYFVPAPWLCVKLLHLLQNYPPPGWNFLLPFKIHQLYLSFFLCSLTQIGWILLVLMIAICWWIIYRENLLLFFFKSYFQRTHQTKLDCSSVWKAFWTRRRTLQSRKRWFCVHLLLVDFRTASYSFRSSIFCNFYGICFETIHKFCKIMGLRFRFDFKLIFVICRCNIRTLRTRCCSKRSLSSSTWTPSRICSSGPAIS